MSTERKELIEICERLPESKRIEVADFARFLRSTPFSRPRLRGVPDRAPKRGPRQSRRIVSRTQASNLVRRGSSGPPIVSSSART